MPNVDTQAIQKLLLSISRHKSEVKLFFRKYGDEIHLHTPTGVARFDKFLSPIVTPVFYQYADSDLKRRKEEIIFPWERDCSDVIDCKYVNEADYRYILVRNPPLSYYKEKEQLSGFNVPRLPFPSKINQETKFHLLYASCFAPAQTGKNEEHFALFFQDNKLLVCPSITRENHEDESCKIEEFAAKREPLKYNDDLYILCQDSIFIINRENGASTKLSLQGFDADNFFVNGEALTLVDTKADTTLKIPLNSNLINKCPDSLTSVDIDKIEGITKKSVSNLQAITIQQASDEEPLLWRQNGNNNDELFLGETPSEVIFFTPSFEFSHSFKTKKHNISHIRPISNGNVTVYALLGTSERGVPCHLLYAKDGTYVGYHKVPTGKTATKAKKTKEEEAVYATAADYITKLDPKRDFSKDEFENFPAVKELGLVRDNPMQENYYTYYTRARALTLHEEKKSKVVVLNTEFEKYTQDGFGRIPRGSSDLAVGYNAVTYSGTVAHEILHAFNDNAMTLFFKDVYGTSTSLEAQATLHFSTPVPIDENTLDKINRCVWSTCRMEGERAICLLNISDTRYLLARDEGKYSILPLDSADLHANPFLDNTKTYYFPITNEFKTPEMKNKYIFVSRTEENDWHLFVWDLPTRRCETDLKLPCETMEQGYKKLRPAGMFWDKDDNFYVAMHTHNTLFLADLTNKKLYSHGIPEGLVRMIRDTDSYVVPQKWPTNAILFNCLSHQQIRAHAPRTPSSPSANYILKFKDGKFEDTGIRDDGRISELLPNCLLLDSAVYDHEAKKMLHENIIWREVFYQNCKARAVIIGHTDPKTGESSATIYVKEPDKPMEIKNAKLPPHFFEGYWDAGAVKVETQDGPKYVGFIAGHPGERDSTGCPTEDTMVVDFNGLVLPMRSKLGARDTALRRQIARCIDKAGWETYIKVSEQNAQKNTTTQNHQEFEQDEEMDAVFDGIIDNPL